MTDIRPALEKWQARIAHSTALAGGIVAAVIVLLVGGGYTGYLLRNVIVEALLRDAAPQPGLAWAVTFASIAAPGILFSAACAVCAVKLRWWSLAAALLALGTVALAVGATLPIRSRNDPDIQPLTAELRTLGADPVVAEAMTGALWMGLLAVGILFALGIAWAATLSYYTPQGALAYGRVYAFVGRHFRWLFPVAVVVGIPILTFVGGTHAASSP